MSWETLAEMYRQLFGGINLDGPLTVPYQGVQGPTRAQWFCKRCQVRETSDADPWECWNCGRSDQTTMNSSAPTNPGRGMAASEL